MNNQTVLNISLTLDGNDMERILKSEYFEKDVKRILSNNSYEITQKLVDEYFKANNTTLEEELKKNVAKVVRELSSYTVFHEKTLYSDEESYGTKKIKKMLDEMEEEIRAKVKEHIEKGITENTNEYLKETLHNLVEEVL